MGSPRSRKESPGNQASSRGEAKDTALLSSRDGYLLAVVLEKTLESPLACKEIQPAHTKGRWERVNKDTGHLFSLKESGASPNITALPGVNGREAGACDWSQSTLSGEEMRTVTPTVTGPRN